MVGHDNVFPLSPKDFFIGRLYSWNQNQAFGQNKAMIMGSIIIHFIDYLPSFLGFSLQATQKIIYVFWFFLTGVAIYVFASLINAKSHFFRLFSTVAYQFNFFVLQGWWIGEKTKISAYIALPLVLAIFLLVYQKRIRILTAVIINSFILFVFNGGGINGIPLYGGFLVSVGLFIGFFTLVSFFEKDHLAIRNLILVALLTIVGFILFNLYYLLPALVQIFDQYNYRIGSIGGISGVLAWAQEISASASFINLFRLQGIPEWYDNPQHPYAKFFLSNPILILISFIFPILSIGALVLIKDKRKLKFVLYFVLVYLTGIFFSAGTHAPLGLFYQLFIRFIPGFAIFRTPYYKFAPALFISCAFLIAFSLDFLREKTKRFSLAFCFFCFLIFFSYYFPYFTGNFFNWRENFSTRLKIPQYVFDFSEWLGNEKKDDYRVLFLPPNNPGWQYDIYRWGYLSLEPLGWLFNKQPLVYINSQNLNKEEQKYLDLTSSALINGDKELFERIAFLLQIKYLVVRKDIFNNLDWAKTESPDLFQKLIERFNYLKKKEFGDWDLYVIDPPQLDKVFSFSNPEILSIDPGNASEDYFKLDSKKENQFLFADKDNLLFSDQHLSNWIIPKCLNCPYREKIDVSIPERKIIPGSLLYSLVILNEKKSIKGVKPEEIIYDYIGFSLKRVGEIAGLILQYKPIKKEYLSAYIETLQNIDKEFDQIENYEKRFQVAEELNRYLEAEREYLYTLFVSGRNYGRDEKEVEMMNNIFLMIHSIQEKIIPYILEDGQSSTRIYSFEIKDTRVFELLINLKTFKIGFENKPEIDVSIDGIINRKIELGQEDLKSNYLNLGEVEIAKGKHHLSLSLSLLPDLVEGPIYSRSDFWGKSMGCFTYSIKDFVRQNLYYLDLSYKNDFSDALLMIINEEKEGKKQDRKFFKFDNSEDVHKLRRFINLDQGSESASVEFCSTELNEELLREKINLQIKESIRPTLVLASKKNPSEINSIIYSKIDPTKYELKIENADKPFFLGFMEKFDSNWQISNFEKTHFKLDGYANGWLIEKPGTYGLTIEYKPQRIFYGGSLVSGTIISMALLYLFLRWIKRI